MFLPGIWWNLHAHSERNSLSLAVIPLPGIVILAVFGTLYGLAPETLASWITGVFYMLFLFLLVGIFRRRHHLSHCLGKARSAPFIIWLAVFTQTLAIGLNPLPVAHESFRRTSLPGRMIASPPDHLIPYFTAVYFFHHFDGIEKADPYFWGWSVTGRGPLVPLGINTLLHVFHSKPADPPNLGIEVAESSGAHVAQLYGWLTNTLVILGAFHLLGVLDVSARRRRMALIWLALSPVLLINGVFLWPKLLTAYFALLSTADVLEGRFRRAGFLLALAALSHPVGAIFVPCIFLFILLTRADLKHPNRGQIAIAVRAFVPFTTVLMLSLAPWYAYKIYLHQPDLFAKYLFGDGRGLAPASNWASWIACRWENLWFTLTPGAYFYSTNMHRWLEEPLGQSLRWGIQYAKTLPGHLGLSAFLIAYISFASGSTTLLLRAFKYSLLVSCFVLMLLFWGYSADGLGRNSLEPLSIFIIVYACATSTIGTGVFASLMTMLYFENRWLEMAGFWEERGFSWGNIGTASWVCWTVSSLIPLGLVVHFWWSQRRHLPVGFSPFPYLPHSTKEDALDDPK
jgi:hypothetical protein